MSIKPPVIVSFLSALLAAICFSFAAACVSPSSVVAYSTVSGHGDVRSDAVAFVALGAFQGSAGVFVKGSGFPLTLPLDTNENEWVAHNHELDTTLRGTLGEDKLPPWCAGLYRPGELEAIGQMLGFVIEIESDKPPMPEPPAHEPQPEPVQ